MLPACLQLALMIALVAAENATVGGNATTTSADQTSLHGAVGGGVGGVVLVLVLWWVAARTGCFSSLRGWWAERAKAAQLRAEEAQRVQNHKTFVTDNTRMGNYSGVY